MEFRSTATLIAAIFCSSTSLAATYQGEVKGTHDDLEEVTTYNLQTSAYFAPVSTEGLPLQEAAFLEEASNLTLSYSRLDNDDYHLDFMRADVNYYVPDSMFFLGGHFFRVKESADEFNPGYSENDWGITLGLTPLNGLLISTKYRSAPSFTGSVLGHSFSSSATFKEDYQPNISAKYVSALHGGRAWKLETTVINGEYDDFLYVGGDYFVDATFSLGLWLEDYDISDNGKGIRAEKFVTSQLSFQGSYLDIGDANAWEIGARIRF